MNDDEAMRRCGDEAMNDDEYRRNIFLEQPRRGKTHEVQLTPYKRSAVWGVTKA